MILVFAVVAAAAKAPLSAATPRAKARRISVEEGSPLHTLWIFSLISVMATDALIMDQEGNRFNDIYKKSEDNTTLDEPIATWELPNEQQLLLGWSFGKWASI